MLVSLWLLTAHLVGDFPLQPDWIAHHKTENLSRLAIHVAVHGILVLPIGWSLYPGEIVGQLLFFAWIVGSHALIDHRRWFSEKEGWGMTWVYINDQILHLVALSLSVSIANLGLAA